MRRLTGIGLVLSALIGSGVAGAVIRDAVIPRGQAATFAGDPIHWYCLNRPAVTCSSGDAEPYATLSKIGTSFASSA
jgi:hypothetical protein